MKKTVIYNGRTFEFQLNLNSLVERTPGGKHQHLLEVSELNGTFKKDWVIDNGVMKAQIANAEKEVEHFAITGMPARQEVETALELGYE